MDMLPSSKAIVPQMKIMLNGLDPKGGRFDNGRNARLGNPGACVGKSASKRTPPLDGVDLPGKDTYGKGSRIA